MQLNSPQYMNSVYNPQGFYPQQYGAYAPYQQVQQQRFQPQEQMLATQMSGTAQQLMPQQAIGLNGRIVQVVENINANEVPMDGSMAFFPKQDLSEIYVKGWNADGTIKTIVYKPYTAPKDNQTNSMSNAENAKFTLSDESTQLFLNKFEELSEKIGQLEDRFDKSLGTQRKTSQSQSKKESDEA